MRTQAFTVPMMAVLAGLLTAQVSGAETPGERFEKAMKKKAEYCATHKIDPANRRCDILKLKPADPLATPEGRFAHSIKIPNPVPEDSGYKPGMTPQEYFEHLCKTEAGEFIYQTVENVEGLYMMRPRKEATDYELQHLYALEDPYGHENAEAKRAEYMFVSPIRYSFLEKALQQPSVRNSAPQTSRQTPVEREPPSRYERFSGYDARDLKSMKKEFVADRKSRYGYTWRGITRPHDRELGIAGGEVIVLDLDTSEVLGVRRGFIQSGMVRNNLTGVWWLTGQSCPQYGYRNGRDKDFDFSYWFIGKVLKPRNYERSFQELTNAK